MDASVGIGGAMEYRALATRGNESTLTGSEQDFEVRPRPERVREPAGRGYTLSQTLIERADVWIDYAYTRRRKSIRTSTQASAHGRHPRGSGNPHGAFIAPGCQLSLA